MNRNRKNRMSRMVVTAFITIAFTTLSAGQIDCADSPKLNIKGDSPATLPNGKSSPFSGFADATVRRDPGRRRLWMAYSYPHLEFSRNTDQTGKRFKVRPAVAIHLASSDNNGKSWIFRNVLWEPTPATSQDGKPGHISHEVVNLLPVNSPKGTVWYAARLDYFLPDEGGFNRRPPQSFRICVSKAASPAALTKAEYASLGAMGADSSWGTIDVNLAKLSPELYRYQLWNEPALWFENGKLYLVLTGIAFKSRRPDMRHCGVVVFATSPDGPPKSWKWQYTGTLAGAQESEELSGERMTQPDLAKSRDGKLLAIMTPDVWDSKRNDFSHRGCCAVEIESLAPARLARDKNGRLKVRASLYASDAGPEGTAAATYDPDSETGIILCKRVKTNAGLGRSKRNGKLQASLHATGVHP